MKNRTYRYWILLMLAFWWIDVEAQPDFDRPIEREPGKCYAKCYFPPRLLEAEVKYFVYTGDDELEENDNLEVVFAGYQCERIVRVKKTMKYGLDTGETMWCYKELPSIEGEEIVVVKDTFWTKDFIEEVYTEVHPLDDEDENEYSSYRWREVLCSTRVNAMVIQELEDSLFEKGYYKNSDGGIHRSLHTELKVALSRFQKVNNLPVGNLDMETLDALGVSY